MKHIRIFEIKLYALKMKDHYGNQWTGCDRMTFFWVFLWNFERCNLFSQNLLDMFYFNGIFEDMFFFMEFER
jgi:hypothetical protein